MPVSVVSRCKMAGVRVADIRTAARLILQELEEGGSELAVSLVDDTEIHRLNREYRGKDRPTDVLAFAMREGHRVTDDDAMLGDVVISLETAARQARRRGVTPAQEVRTLLIHGVLHLFGYDHERSAAEAKAMKAMERRLQGRLRGAPSSRRSTRAL